KPQQGGTTPC
ncbi:hP0423 family protein, partial [Helicobacter pylori]